MYTNHHPNRGFYYGNHTFPAILIPQGASDILKSNTPMFHNPIPRFDVPTYSIHVDQGAHTSSHCATHACELVQSAKRALHNPGQRLYP